MVQATATAVTVEPILVDGETCRDWREASELEWLESNGAGGYAMGTVSGANTRRYHGVLVASLKPPVERAVLLSRVEEEVLCDGEQSNLGACQYPGVVSPTGFQSLDEFRLDPFPVWRYKLGCTTIQKSLFLVHGRQTAVLVYRATKGCRLRVRPFVAFRDYHGVRRAGADFRKTAAVSQAMVSLEPIASMPALHLHHNGAGFVQAGNWYYQIEYKEEMARGMEFREDLFSPGWVDYELGPGETVYLVATIEDGPAPTLVDVVDWEREERQRREEMVLEGFRATSFTNGLAAFRAQLELAAEQFLVRRVDGSPTILAGYPWFTDWGRDTMISLPGLLVARKRFEEARQMLTGFLRYLNQGLIPNRFPDAGEEPEYNTADGTLWMFPVAWALENAGGNEQFLRETFYPAAKEILAWHRRGTHYDIRVDPVDGLLSCGGPGTQLTWMDAKVGDWVVTPRHGKPVEINALWYNALRMTAWWAQRYGEFDFAAQAEAEADRVLWSFEATFWNDARGCLYDRIGPEGPDDRLRPNQLFALSLPFPLMNPDQQHSILQVVEERLLTPIGLRTLEPGHPEYRPRYEGSPHNRDGAYHQGTIWPWLIGPYVSARLQVHGHTLQNVDHCRGLIKAFEGELHRGCLGSIAEIYDAEPPHRPVGCPAQAWSVAEVLRVMGLL